MTELVKYVIGNLSKLEGSHLILIFIFTFFFVIGIYTFFRNLFKKLFEAQSDLIKLKEEIISNYKNLLDVSKTNSEDKETYIKQLENELRIFKTNGNELNTKLSQVINNYIQLNLFTRKLKIAYNDMHILLNYWRSLSGFLIYYIKKNSPDKYAFENINDQFIRIADNLSSVVDVSDYLMNINDPFCDYQIPDKLNSYDNEQVESEMDKHGQLIYELVDKESKTLES